MAESRENNFLGFCLFTLLYRRFRLSRVWHAQDLDEIYRLVSKNLNFMPCGSVFDRFSVLLYKKVPWVLKSFRGGHRTPDLETQQNRHGHFVYNKIQKRPNTEPQGVPEALDGTVR